MKNNQILELDKKICSLINELRSLINKKDKFEPALLAIHKESLDHPENHLSAKELEICLDIVHLQQKIRKESFPFILRVEFDIYRTLLNINDKGEIVTKLTPSNLRNYQFIQKQISEYLN